MDIAVFPDDIFIDVVVPEGSAWGEAAGFVDVVVAPIAGLVIDVVANVGVAGPPGPASTVPGPAGPAGPPGAGTPPAMIAAAPEAPMHQNQGQAAVATASAYLRNDANLQNIYADDFGVMSSDLSELRTVTIGTPAVGDTVTITDTAHAGYTASYTVAAGDTASNVASKLIQAIYANSAWITALANYTQVAGHPSLNSMNFGHGPVQATSKGANIAGGCDAQIVGPGQIAFDYPYGMGTLTVSRSGPGGTTIALSAPVADGGPYIDLTRLMIGRNWTAGDLAGMLLFQGNKDATSTGTDSQQAAIFTEYTNANSVRLILQSLQGGVSVNKLCVGAGVTQYTAASGPGTPDAPDGVFRICGTASGYMDFAVPPTAGSSKITWPGGTTNFSMTGGTANVVQQAAAGAPFTVAPLSRLQGSPIILSNPSGATTVDVGVAGVSGGQIIIAGGTSGSQTWSTADNTSGLIKFPAGSIDFNGTGGANQVIQQNAVGGGFSVAEPQPHKPYFRAHRSVGQALTNNNPATIGFNVVDYDTNACYNVSNGQFTPSVPGLYFFSTSVTFNGDFTAAGANAFLSFVTASATVARQYYTEPSMTGLYDTLTLTTILQMNGSTDWMSVQIQLAGANLNVAGSTTSQVYFYGYRLGPS